MTSAPLGLTYAALNLYWAGGDRWRGSYGSHVVGARFDDGSIRVASLVLAILMAGAVGVVLLAVTLPWDSRARTPVRYLAWIAAGMFGLDGLALTVIGLYVRLSVSGPGDGTTAVQRAHAFVWDPWFLVWGVAMTAALLCSARAYLRSAHRAPDPVRVRG